MRTTSFSTPDYISDPVRNFAARRGAEALGLLLLIGIAALGVALMSWSAADPSLDHATIGPVHNALGGNGAIFADVLMQLFGLANIALLLPPLVWGWHLLRERRLPRLRVRLALWLTGILASLLVAAALPASGHWPLPTGLGGVTGDALIHLLQHVIGTSIIARIVIVLAAAATAVLSLNAACEAPTTGPSATVKPALTPRPSRQSAASQAAMTKEDDDEPGLALVALGALVHAGLALKATVTRRLRAKPPATPSATRAPWLSIPALDADSHLRDDEVLAASPPTRSPHADGPPFDVAPRPAVATMRAPVARVPAPTPTIVETDRSASLRVTPAVTTLRPSSRSEHENHGQGFAKAVYELPPLFLMAEAKKNPANTISEDALEQNARLLEGVLDDFGVRGEIINVRPGPVVTLYELEPAPGIKSSRVIGLADDIARSMSALSARVAVVQGRNAIGIELPNQRRETVWLRELIGSHDFEGSKHKLAIALGKTIGGEPVIVDLARMPHLLVAGTTGSGKSVAINTMILSLLYRLKPEECRLIMVDPKMLELSVYDGIPHLLTPVVTDPKKAVVALKWAVREMEDRYKKMSKVGVRNIDGFNARVAEASAKGEIITRTVQTGYDKQTGEAVYEQEQMDLTVLPYIVVIVDEMADLMMVAGKDIEGAIQRLAQMARAAGIHLIMATQRPSVDVITGTIKANFPTRISFQVTSKIDSRTILGEQGAEQLLGQGDMLYMAGGGRISRVHGPFVSDSEVEKIVAHLKTQGQPEYLEAITSDDDDAEEATESNTANMSPGSMDDDESGDYYDRAVKVVMRDRKCSTSYIQRRLSVGYNKAASLVERMEKEGIVSAPNHSGKREVLLGEAHDSRLADVDDD